MRACWAIVDKKNNEIIGSGATEGQAWISAFSLTGQCFTGAWLFRMKLLSGCEAVELRQSC